MNKIKSLALISSIAIATAFSISCSSDDGDGGGIKNGAPVTYEGETYPTVKIGKQTWMAKNLNYATEGSVCYDEKPANCDKYGRLYNWDAAMKACPSGWHLPSYDEWNVLKDVTGGKRKDLSATTGWYRNEGLDTYGFAALPGGYGDYDHSQVFNLEEDGGWWWTSTDASSGKYNIAIYSLYANMDWQINSKSDFYSVRCVKD